MISMCSKVLLRPWAGSRVCTYMNVYVHVRVVQCGVVCSKVCSKVLLRPWAGSCVCTCTNMHVSMSQCGAVVSVVQ